MVPVVVGLAMTRVAERYKVGWVVVGLVVVYVMHGKAALGAVGFNTANLAHATIPLSYLLLEFLCELVVVDRPSRIGQATTHICAIQGAILPSVHMGANMAVLSGKDLAAVLASKLHDFGGPSSIIALLGAVHATTIGHATALVGELLTTYWTRLCDAITAKLRVAFARAENVVKAFSVVRRSMDWLAASGTRFVPSCINTFTRAESTLSLFDLVAWGEEGSAAGFTSTLDFLDEAFAPAFARAELALCGGGSLKGLAAELTVVKHRSSSSVRAKIRNHFSGAPGTEARLVSGRSVHSSPTRSISHIGGNTR